MAWAHPPPPLQCPLASQVCPVAQLPQEPPQPSEPHCLPPHCGLQTPPVTWHWLALLDHSVCTKNPATCWPWDSTSQMSPISPLLLSYQARLPIPTAAS